MTVFNDVALDGEGGGQVRIEDTCLSFTTPSLLVPLRMAWSSISGAKQGVGDSKSKVRVSFRDSQVKVFLMASDEDASAMKQEIMMRVRGLREAPHSVTEADMTESEAFYDEEAPRKNGYGRMARIPERSTYTPMTTSDYSNKPMAEPMATQIIWKPSNTSLMFMMVFNMACCFVFALIVIALLSVLVHRSNALVSWGSLPTVTTTTKTTPVKSTPVVSTPVETPREVEIPAPDVVVTPSGGGDCDITAGPSCVFAGDEFCYMNNCEFECNEYKGALFVFICPSCAELREEYCRLIECCPACADSANELLQCKLEQDQTDECNWDLASAC